MKYRIFLGTQSDCIAFCDAANNCNRDVFLTHSNGKYRINAKSILGCLMASAEWGDDVWIETEEEAYWLFDKWILNQADDAANIHE